MSLNHVRTHTHKRKKQCVFLCAHRIVQHERYGVLTLVNTTGADTGEYTCYPMYCEDTDCRKEYDKAINVFVFFPGRVKQLYCCLHMHLSSFYHQPLYLIASLTYLVPVLTRPTWAVCSIIWLLWGNSAENKLADTPPLPSDVSWGQGNAAPRVPASGGGGGWHRDLLQCQERLHHQSTAALPCWSLVLCSQSGQPAAELNQVHAHLCQL